MYKSCCMFTMQIVDCMICDIVLTGFLEVNTKYMDRMKVDTNVVAMRGKNEDCREVKQSGS